jgi:nondiscriminating glutamyl-tRNA synthetase
VLLYQALGFAPPAFAHLALVMGPDHSPLSKRHGATSVAEFRAHGYLPEAMTNYLALLGWSPGGDQELLPINELARRFAIEDVGHSAGVFDPEKLAWMNRHYMKVASPARLSAECARYFLARGYLRRRSDEAMEYMASILPMATIFVDRLEEIPDRLRFLFEFDPAASLARSEVAEVVEEQGGREVILALAEELRAAGRLDREAFRAAANRVKQRTGQKARALFHPIRVALTGEAAGPELDLAVPAIDRGAELPSSVGIAPIVGCRERAEAFAAALVARS